MIPCLSSLEWACDYAIPQDFIARYGLKQMLIDTFDSWRHGEAFEVETLDILLEGQGECLKVLEINNCYDTRVGDSSHE